MDKKPEFHGSDLEKITEYYHISPEGIVMFGANVNPLGLSQSVKADLAAHLDIISSYPDREYTNLRKTISTYTGAKPEHIVVGNGSTELISLLISQRKARHALVLGPAYSEYERELSLNNGKITYYNLKESENFILDTEDFLKCLPEDADLVILCNPNNPTSSTLMSGDIERIVKTCREREIFVMIDETYAEFAPDISAVTAIPLAESYDNLMVIRGVSKFFAAPGLRFGYGITSSTGFLQTLRTVQNPWSLNSIGAYAGELMLKDKEYIDKTYRLICSERDRMQKRLAQMPGIKTYPAYGNFILVRILKEGLTSFDVFEAAIKEKMMIRDCSSFQSLNGEYIRFCIMMPEDNDRLLNCIERCVNN